ALPGAPGSETPISHHRRPSRHAQSRHRFTLAFALQIGLRKPTDQTPGPRTPARSAMLSGDDRPWPGVEHALASGRHRPAWSAVTRPRRTPRAGSRCRLTDATDQSRRSHWTAPAHAN